MNLDDLMKTKAGQDPGNAARLREAGEAVARASRIGFPLALAAVAQRSPDVPRCLPGMRQIGSEDGLNKTERAYLTWLRTLGDQKIWVKAIGLRLYSSGKSRSYYYPDFVALDSDGMRVIDTKGTMKNGEPWIEEDSLLKFRWAAQMYAPIRFFIAWKVDGAWKHRLVAPGDPVSGQS